MLINRKVELRQLSMDSEEDKWFVKELKSLPEIIYDQTMLAKLLPKSALLSLEQQQVMTSEFMRILRFEIKGSTFELIQFVYFAEEDQKVTADYKSNLYDRLY